MNPLASFSGGGGLSASSSATATSGDAFGKAGTGQKIVTLGGNPNTVAGVAQNPVVILGLLAAAYLLMR